MSNQFTKASNFKSAWQILSSQSAKITSWFVAIVATNFMVATTRIQVEGVPEAIYRHQILFVLIMGFIFGNLELLLRRQEYIASLPISRKAIFANRLFHGLIVVAVAVTSNYFLRSGLAESALFGGPVETKPLAIENWMKESVALAAIFIIQFSLGIVTRTYTGILISQGIIAYMLSIIFVTGQSLQSLPVVSFLAIVAILHLLFGFLHFHKSEQLCQQIKSLSRLHSINFLTIMALVCETAGLLYLQEGSF